MSVVLLALLSRLLLTCLLELIILLPFRPGKSWLKASILCNVLTNPLLNLLIMLLRLWIGTGWYLYGLILLLEIAVVFSEGRLYQLILDASAKKSLMLSAVCNAFSFFLGLFLK